MEIKIVEQESQKKRKNLRRKRLAEKKKGSQRREKTQRIDLNRKTSPRNNKKQR
jgi:hypothetical protein